MSAAASVLPEPENRGQRWLRAFICSLPVLLVVCVVLTAESPFVTPKRALLSTAAFGVFFVAAAMGGLRRLERSSWLALAAIPAATLLAWAASGRPDLGGQMVLMICAGPLLAWTTSSLFRGSGKRLLVAIAISGVAEALVAIAQWGFHFDMFRAAELSTDLSGRMRLYGTMGNPDFVAIYIAATMPVLIGFARRATARTQWLSWTGLTVDAIALAGAGSRTAIVAAVCGCAAVLLFERGGLRQRLKSATMLVLLAVVLAASVGLRNPRTTTTGARGRFFMWGVSLVHVSHRPLGDGPGTFAYLYPAKMTEFLRSREVGAWQRFIGYESTANSDYVQALADSGWPGLAALIAVLVFVALRLGRAARAGGEVETTALGVVIALAVAAAAESPLQRAESWALLWLCAGLALTSAPSNTGPVRAMPLRVAFALVLTTIVAWFALKPVRASYWAGIGERQESERRHEDAVASYRRALVFDPAASSAAFYLPRALAHTGDLDAATSAVNDGLRWIDEPELRLLRLRILESRGNYVAALQAAADDVQRFPYSPELREEYMQLASRLQSR